MQLYTQQIAPTTAVPSAKPLTLAVIIAVEPRVAAVIAAAARCRRMSYRNRVRIYESAKSHLALMVGWRAKDRHLSSSDAYECVMHKLAEATGI